MRRFDEKKTINQVYLNSSFCPCYLYIMISYKAYNKKLKEMVKKKKSAKKCKEEYEHILHY